VGKEPKPLDQSSEDDKMIDHGILAGMTWHSFDLEIERQQKIIFEDGKTFD